MRYSRLWLSWREQGSARDAGLPRPTFAHAMSWLGVEMRAPKLRRLTRPIIASDRSEIGLRFIVLPIASLLQPVPVPTLRAQPRAYPTIAQNLGTQERGATWAYDRRSVFAQRIASHRIASRRVACDFLFWIAKYDIDIMECIICCRS